jgi:hypothetical protein
MLLGGEGGVLTFSEIGDGTSTGGWFSPVRKHPPQKPDSAQRVRSADLGGSSWFTPSRQAAQQPGPDNLAGAGEASFRAGEADFPGGANSGDDGGNGSWTTGYRDAGSGDPGSRVSAFEGWQNADGRGPDGPDSSATWREVPSRGITAANRWAEVTRGGSPAGRSRGRDDGDDRGYPPDSGYAQWHDGSREAVPDDVPFRGARPIDVSTSGSPPARRGPAYSAAAASAAPGGSQRRPDTGSQRRPDTGALRRIKESGAMRAIMDTGAMRALMDTTAMQMLRERYAGKGKALAIAGISLWVVLVALALLIFTHHG